MDGTLDTLYLLLVPTTSGVQPSIVRIRETDTGYGIQTQTNPAQTRIDPTILSISANPIQGGAKLSVDAWSGDGISHSYQWQVQEPDGEWSNIPGATGQVFEYTGLAPGEYFVRCIVGNSTGGETISDPVLVVVS
jgi:hypothetical protein